ncbi:MAG: hypothetical protein KJ703_05445 [Alphaproteobacteria bacterium]|nr:hypothetical protein [Alphaproteobacteria bacterium]
MIAIATRRIGPAIAGAAAALLLGLGAPAAAQQQPLDPESEVEEFEQAGTQNEGLSETARTADTGIGEVGQRQTTRDGPVMREPLDRIDSRINNRVENRIRNRIDRYYDPTANATSPYANADRQSRASRLGGPR